jgi:hypothetical protein
MGKSVVRPQVIAGVSGVADGSFNLAADRSIPWNWATSGTSCHLLTKSGRPRSLEEFPQTLTGETDAGRVLGEGRRWLTLGVTQGLSLVPSAISESSFVSI